ncbi:MAG: hypothetical protein AAGC97_04790 [Planctomycetota bacterium]
MGSPRIAVKPLGKGVFESEFKKHPYFCRVVFQVVSERRTVDEDLSCVEFETRDSLCDDEEERRLAIAFLRGLGEYSAVPLEQLCSFVLLQSHHYHEVDSNEFAYFQAGKFAAKQLSAEGVAVFMGDQDG